MTVSKSPRQIAPATHIVICGSMSALTGMEALARQLRRGGYRVTTPVPEESSLDWSQLPLEDAVALKRSFLNGYFDVIRKADAILIFNSEKHGIDGYVGANTLMEAACAHALGKPVVFVNAIGDQSCQLEALAISAEILEGDPSRLHRILPP